MDRVEHEVNGLDTSMIDQILDDAEASLDADSGFMNGNARLVGVAVVLLAVAIVVIGILMNRNGNQSLIADD
jgi:hypothetical protein